MQYSLAQPMAMQRVSLEHVAAHFSFVGASCLESRLYTVESVVAVAVRVYRSLEASGGVGKALLRLAMYCLYL
jgi:hypothetical protein